MNSENNDSNTSGSSDSPPFNADDSNDQLSNIITTMAGKINASNSRFLKVIAEFNRRKAWTGAGIRSFAFWLNWKCGIGMGAAREKVRVAIALDGLPKINSAFPKGQLSFSKVRAMTRVATTENESNLLNIAKYGTAQHMDKLVGAFRKVSRYEDFTGAAAQKVMGQQHESILVDESEVDKKRDQGLYESRAVSCFQDDEGMWIIKAKLPAEQGGLLVKLLDELGSRLATPEKKVEIKKDEDVEIKAGQASNKKFEKNSAGTFSEYKKDDEPKETLLEENRLTFTQRRADALVALSENFLATAGDANNGGAFATLKAHERCQLVLHVHHTNGNTPGQASNGSGLQDNLDGRWLLPDAARRLACDAGLLLVEQDAVGNVLNVGRRSRIIPAAMFRALKIRDGGCCQFPGCCASRYVEGHHIIHWADGGETRLDNLVTLCSYHHRELRRGKYYLSLKNVNKNSKQPVPFADRLCFTEVERYHKAPFRPEYVDEEYHQIIPQNPATFTCACHGFNEFEKSLPRSVFDAINAKTAVTRWCGERMDLGMAVEGLIRASGMPLRFFNHLALKILMLAF
jgi:hypothetical protein